MWSRESCLLFVLSAALSKVLISSRCCISTLLTRCFLTLFLFAFSSAPVLYTWMFPMEHEGASDSIRALDVSSLLPSSWSEPNRPMVKLVGCFFFLLLINRRKFYARVDGFDSSDYFPWALLQSQCRSAAAGNQ